MLLPTRKRSATLVVMSSVVSLYLFFLGPFAGPSTNTLAHSEYTATSQARVLLVSALFPLVKSKHTKEDYARWLSNFLGPITTDVYFFTTPDWESLVREARGNNVITVNTSYDSPFAIPPLKGLESIYTAMHEKDREKKYHSPELYAVWNGKAFFLNKAVKMVESEGKVYDYAFWNDAGSFRDEHRFQNWPDAGRVEDVFHEASDLTKTNQEDLILFPISMMPDKNVITWQENMGPVDNDVSEGSFFGGKPQAVAWWAETFYAYHDYYMQLDYFVGKDQTIINSIFLLFPERFVTVWRNDPRALKHKGVFAHVYTDYLGSCGPEWWYYQFWLSDPITRELMRDIWSGRMEWGTGWADRHRCRLTSVLSMRDVFQRWFGKDWNQPLRTLDIPRGNS